jgi:hypothetical protein
MLLDALSATAHDLAIGLALSLAAVFLLLLIRSLWIRSNLKLKEREAALRQKESKELIPAFIWPPKPADLHPRSHEAIVPQAGRKAA